MDEALNATAPGRPDVSAIEATPTLLVKGTIAEFLPKSLRIHSVTNQRQPSKHAVPIIFTVAIDFWFVLLHQVSVTWSRSMITTGAPSTRILLPRSTRKPRRAHRVWYQATGGILVSYYQGRIHKHNHFKGKGTQPTEKGATWHLKLFLASGQLVFIAMNILSSFPERTNGHQFLLIMKDGYPKLTRAVKISEKSVVLIASIFLNHAIVPYRAPVYIWRKITRYSWESFSKPYANYLG